jgi:hypothetical protein
MSACAVGSFVVALAVTSAAGAQQKPQAAPPGGARSSGQFTLRGEEPGGPAGAAARGRARAGDCAGALPLFDSALRTSIEPTLWRDRGLCHEKLGHPYPAADDYRSYLVARPDAPDADSIRQRLAALEAQQTGAGGEAVRDESSSASYKASVTASASTGEGVKTSSESSSKKAPRVSQAEGEKYDDFVEKERAADLAYDSPLRFGTGFVTGVYLHIPRYFFSEGSTSDMAYSLGATLRYAVAPAFVLLSEVGYAGVGDTGADSSAGGPLVFLGAEVRLAISKHAGDQIFFGVGADYERYKNSRTRNAANFILGRGRVGYRHIFGPSVGLEIMGDGGPGTAWADEGGKSVGVTALGGSVALLFAF